MRRFFSFSFPFGLTAMLLICSCDRQEPGEQTDSVVSDAVVSDAPEKADAVGPTGDGAAMRAPDGDPAHDATGVGQRSDAPFDPFAPGPYAVTAQVVGEKSGGAPKKIALFVPKGDGPFPCVFFHHGFTGNVDDYGEILSQLASHGFVTAAAQMYPPGNAFKALKTPEESKAAKVVHAWLREHLGELTHGAADTSVIGLAGHSRAGKLVFGLLEEDPSYADAVAGVDPVDGSFDFAGFGGEPRLIDGPFGFSAPSLVIGTGLGPKKKVVFAPACAPEGDNHEQFFAAAQTPSWHVLVPSFGHNDMMDEDMSAMGRAACPAGEDLSAMRRLTAGLLVAFFKASLQDKSDAYLYLEHDRGVAPAFFTSEHK